MLFEKNIKEIDVLIALLSSEQELSESVRIWMIETLVGLKKIEGA
ncbi:hypothetical protein ACN08N_23450 [Photobacterium leiognathi subsp. mandapamensis]